MPLTNAIEMTIMKDNYQSKMVKHEGKGKGHQY